MKYVYILFLFVIVPQFTQAQTETFINRIQEPLSPSEQRYNLITSDIKAIVQKELYANPAFYEMLHQNTSIWKGSRRKKSAIMTAYANGELDGDFLPAEGNKFEDFRLLGSGEYSLDSAGTLFGAVQYSRGKHENIGWNTVRHPDLYLPYVTTDSIGGDFNFEGYMINGGYSFKLKNVFLGINGYFRGEQAHRKSDPRALNTTTWLNINAGIGYIINKHVLMLNAGYERNKQHVTLRYWRPGQQDRFWVAYGFGLYDTKHSTVSFGYSRMYYISGVNMGLSYISPTNKALSVTAKLAYRYNSMKTEETDIRDLYHLKAHYFNPTVNINWTPKAAFHFDLLLSSNTVLRNGYENIFEQYLVDKINNVYDFRLIDTRQKYKKQESENLAQLKAVYNISSVHSINLLGGANLSYKNETYKDENYKISATAILPHVGAGYQLNTKKSEFNFNALYITKKMLSDKYNVNILNTSIKHIDFHHAFTPYAFNNSTFSAININTSYVYHLKKYGVGINFKLMYKRGDRADDAVYLKEIGFNSIAPKVDPIHGKHNEIWSTVALFVVF